MRIFSSDCEKAVRLIFWGLVLAALSYGDALAQRWVRHSIHHGLAGDAVNDMLVDQAGDLWIATNNGVNRFNGTWSVYRTAQGLAHNDVQAIVQDGDGNIWFGTRGGGISKINPAADLENPANWQNYNTTNTKNGLASDSILSILIDRQGKLWFGTEDRGISVVDPTPDLGNNFQDPLHDPRNWKTFTIADGLGDNTVLDMESDASGNIWVVAVGTAINIYEFVNERWTTFRLEPADANQNAKVIFKDRNNHVWIGTESYGVYRVYPNNLTTFDEHYTINNPLAGSSVLAIAQDRAGALWFGHRGQGVTMIMPEGNITDQKNWEHFSTTEGLGDNQISAIVVDTEENIWFGHPEERGVTQLDRTWLTLPFLTQGIIETNFVEGLFSDKQRSLWMATRAAAVRVALDANLPLGFEFSDDVYTKAHCLDADNVFAVFQDSRSFLWFGTSAGANRVAAKDLVAAIDIRGDCSKWRNFDKSTGLVSNQARWITEDRLGYLWLASGREGVNRVHIDSTALVDRWMTITKSDGLASNQVFMILPDKRGKLWFATDNGVSLFDPASNPKSPANWTKYNTNDGLADDRVRAIFEDMEGNIWFATDGGVSQVDPTKNLRDPINWKNYTVKDGLASNFVTSIAQLKKDVIWFGTAAGASQFKLKENSWTTYILSSILSSNFVTSVFADTVNQDLWFGTDGGGAVRYRPKKRPPITILDTHYDLVTGNSITFNFHGADLITPSHELRFQYRLDDSDWQETSDRSATVLVEDADKPQRHVFAVRAIDGDGNIDETPASDGFYKIGVRRTGNWGGNIETIDGDRRIRLYIPPGVLKGDTSITITSVERFDAADAVIAAYDFSPKPFTLAKPATLSISFPNTQVSDPNQIAIFRRDGSRWTGIGGTVTSEGNLMTVATAITELDTFAVRNIRVSRRERAIAEVNIQPRVFSPAGGGRSHGDRANISFALQDDAMVSVKVYDLAGRLKRIVKENTSLAAGVNVVAWDGRDDNGRLCVSGLYVVAIEAQGSVQTKTVVVANDK